MSCNSPNTSLTSNQAFLAKYLSLEQPADKIQITYVYLHPGNDDLEHFCGKTKVVSKVPQSVDELPIWDSGVPTDSCTEILLRPVRIYNDPFRRGNNKLVLCDTLSADMKPLPSNHRAPCLDAMNKAAKEHPWFGMEQEYMLMDGDNPRWPLGWPRNGFPEDIHLPHVLYHSAVGANRQVGRDVMEAHFRACLYAGVNISGENAEAMLAQWEYQVGPCEGIQIGDDVMMSRYILHRVAEELHIGVTFDPRPIPHWLGAGAHMNFSTAKMRAIGGLAEIERAIEKLSKRHEKHLARYDPRGGLDNQRRLTSTGGDFYASDASKFTSGVANRAASVRIPKMVANNGQGYMEDRRPASNCDPYMVSEALVRTCCLNE